MYAVVMLQFRWGVRESVNTRKREYRLQCGRSCGWYREWRVKLRNINIKCKRAAGAKNKFHRRQPIFAFRYTFAKTINYGAEEKKWTKKLLLCSSRDVIEKRWFIDAVIGARTADSPTTDRNRLAMTCARRRHNNTTSIGERKRRATLCESKSFLSALPFYRDVRCIIIISLAVLARRQNSALYLPT